MKPLNKHIILKRIPEKKLINGIIIPNQLAANQITFAKVIALPNEQLDTKNLKVGDYVVLGYSAVWDKKYKYKIENEEYLVVNEYAILAIITDDDLLNLVDMEEQYVNV